MKLLFVCTGNSCRSVMAQFLLRKLAAERGLGWEARSCGVAAERYFPVPDGVRQSLADRGIEKIEHVPQLVSRELLAWADLVVPMARPHRDALLDEYPEHTGKIQLFSEFAGRGEEDVADPIGQPVSVYRRCRDIIEQGLAAALERHAANDT